MLSQIKPFFELGNRSPERQDKKQRQTNDGYLDRSEPLDQRNIFKLFAEIIHGWKETGTTL